MIPADHFMIQKYSNLNIEKDKQWDRTSRSSIRMDGKLLKEERRCPNYNWLLSWTASAGSG